MRSTALAASRSLRSAHSSVKRSPVPGRSLAPRQGLAVPPRRTVVARASEAKEEIDFDKILIILAQKWDAADNKVVVVGWSAAAVFALFFSEWFIHLPVLDWLVGFPIQLVGLFTVPYITVRWLLNKEDWFEDVSQATATVVDVLPGLKPASAEKLAPESTSEPSSDP